MREVDTQLLAAISAPVFYPVALVFLDWPDAPVRAHSGVGTLVWDSQEWIGVSRYGDLQLPEEAFGLGADPATAVLRAVGGAFQDYLEDDIKGRRASVWIGAVTERAGNVLVGAPLRVFTGTMDVLRLTISAETENLRNDLLVEITPGPSQREFSEVYHTDEDQRRLHPADTAGRLVQNAEARALTLKWPE